MTTKPTQQQIQEVVNTLAINGTVDFFHMNVLRSSSPDETRVHLIDLIRHAAVTALAQQESEVTSEQGEIVLTKAGGRLVAVTRQDEEGRILKVLWELGEDERNVPAEVVGAVERVQGMWDELAEHQRGEGLPPSIDDLQRWADALTIIEDRLGVRYAVPATQLGV